MNKNNNVGILFSKRFKKHDIIEKKDIELNHIKNNTNDIKKSSIKEFIYSNRKVPKSWKTKKHYNNLVLEIFSEDNNFLKYLGSNVEKHTDAPIDINIERPKTSKFENRNRKIELINSGKSKHKRFEMVKNKFIKTSNTHSEIHNIFEGLKEKYPIKEKLPELFPYYDFDEEKKQRNINSFDNYKTFKTSKLVENSVETNKLKKIKKIEKNIYNNIFLNYKKNITSTNRRISKEPYYDFDYKRKNRIKLMKKELNDPKIFYLLNKVNLYGPYYSYCPNCFDKNINFYKNIGKRQCISLLNYIKKGNNKKTNKLLIKC